MQDPQLLESVRQQTASLPEAVALEVVDPETKAMRDALAKQALKTGFNWKRAGLISLAAVMSFGILGFSAFAIRTNQKSDVNEAKATYAVSSVPLSGITSESVLGLAQIGQLDLNGIVKVNGALVLTPSTQPQDAQAGQIYFDKTSGSVLYYTGTEFREVSTTGNTVKSINGITGDIRLGPSLTFANGVLGANIPPQTAIAVTSVQGQTGDVLFTSGAGIAITGASISNTGVTSFAGQTGNLTVGRGLTVTAGVLSSTSVISSGSANIIITDNGNGNYTIADSGVGGAGNVALGPVAPQTDNTANPSISIDKTGAGDLLNLLVNGSTTFRVNNTGLIVNGSIDYSQVTNRPATTVTSVGGASGAITVGTGLSLAANNLTNTGVTSLSGTPNQVTVSGATGNITLSLPQNIATTSSPTFAALTLSSALSVGNGGTGATTAAGARSNLGAAASGANSDITSLTGLSVITPAAGLTVGSTTQNLILQGNASTTLTATSGAFTSTLAFAAPTANQTITIPNASGTICLSSGNCPSTGVGGSGTVNTIPLFNGATSLADSIISQNGLGTTITIGGDLTVSGNLSATNLSGNGSGLTSLNATNISSGTLNDARLSANVTLQGNTFNGPSQLVQLNASSQLPAVSGALLTNLNATNISGGTLNDARLSANVTLQGNSFNGVSQLVQTNASGQLPVLSGVNLTNLNASALTSGTVNDARLSANVTVQGNTFNGANQLVQLNGSGQLPAVSGVNLINLNGSAITTGIVGVGVGGTGATTAGGARTNLGAAASGANSDITSLTGLTVINPGAALTIGNTGQALTLQGSATTSLTATSGAFTSALVFQSPSVNATITVPNATGTICLSTGNCLGGAGGGANTALSNLASVSLNTSLLPGSSTIDLGSNSAPFQDLYIGGTATTNFKFTGVATAARTITVPDATGTLCLSTGNCAGAGSGITGSGTANKLAVFSAGQNIVDSIISQNAGATIVTVTGDLSVTGTISGNGSGLTSLNGSNISSGTVADTRLSANVTLQGNTFNGNNQLVQINGSGQLPAVSGALLTTLNASNLSSGTVADARLTTNVTLAGNAFNGANQLVQLTASGFMPALNGAALTSLNATNITSGIVAVGVGGTGITSYTTGDLIYASGTTTLAKLAAPAAGQCLISNGVGVAPSWGSCTAGGGGFTSLTLAGDSGSNQTISDTDTINIVGGTNVFTSAGATDTVTISTVNNPTFSGTVTASGSGTSLAVTNNVTVGGTINTASISGGTLSGGSFSGGTVTGGTLNTTSVNGVTTADIVLTTGTYADPAFITSLAKSKVGLSNVENTALSTWAGSTNLTTLGTITSGTWQASVISDTYVSDTLTVGATGNVDWTALNNYPVACGAGTAITALGDTPTCTAFAASSGSGSYIQNTTSLQSSANLYIQSTAVGSVTAKYRALGSQTADIIQVRDSGDSSTVFAVAPSGNVTGGTYNGATITSGTLSGGSLSATAVNGVNIADIIVSTGSYVDPAWITSLAKSKVGLSNVENTALSAWAGSTNLTTLGTVTTGAWTASVIADAYINDALTVSSAGTVDWAALNSYPSACSAGTAITALGDTPTCTAFAAGSGSGSYIQNQNAGQQSSSNFWLSGTGRADTSFTAPLFDTPSAAALNIGTTNATQINLNKNTQLTGNLTFASGTNRSISLATPATLNASGNELSVLGATANGTGAGGALRLIGGEAPDTGAGGSVYIYGGGSDTGSAGSVYIDPGQAGSAFNPGNINIGTVAGGGTINMGNISDGMGINILNAGTINVGTGAVGSIINLGTGAGIKTITIGSSNTTSTTNIISGSGGINLTGTTKIANLTTAGIVTNTAAGVLGTVASIPVANGGTGATTTQGAINAISQLTTTGDILYYDGTNSTRLARGINGQCLTSNTTTILWGSCGAAGTDLQGAYNSGSAGDQIISLGSTNDSLIFRNPASSGTDSNQVLTVEQLNTGSLDALVVNNAGTGNILNLQDNGTTVLKVTDGGNITALGASTGTTGTTEATARTNVTTVTLTAAGSFANNDIIFINNAGQDYYTRIVSGGGTTTLTVSPEVSYDASATVTKYLLQNIGATSTDYTTQSNRFFQGYFLGGVVTGAGSTTLSDGSITSTNGLKLQTATGVSVQGTNSSTAFSVNNSAGTNILVVDSTANVIKAGAVTAPVVNNYTVNENFTTNAPTGTFYGVATYSAGNYLQLNSGNDNSGNIEYNPSLESDFTANFEFYTSGGADAVYFYAYNSSTPTVENQASGGYMVSFSEYGGYIALTYNGTTLANVSQSGMNNSTWRTVQIIKSGYNIKVYLDGALKIDYTDSLRLLPGTKMGLGARSGGTSGTHRVRNLDVDWSVTTPGTNPVLNINTTTGQTVFTSSTNSTSAFKIQNSSNQNVLNVDTQNAFVGINTSSASAALQVAPSGASSTFSDGFESGSLGTFSVTGQSYQWGITTATKHTGTYAVGVSNTLAYNEVTEIKTVKTIGANGGIISWWRYHNGATDLLLYIDGVQVFNDGNANQGSWVQNSYIVSAGTHTITWRVDFGQGGGRSASDAVYIDDISITNVTSSTASAIFEGGVGIGSTSVPTHTLDVNTSSSATSWLSVKNGSSLQGGLLFNEGQVYGIQAAAQNTNQTNGSLVFDYRNMFDGSVAQSKILTINGTGFVGIGTDAPTASLQITPTASTYIQDFESGSIAPFNSLTSAPYDWTASNTIAHGGSYSAYANNSAGLNQLVEFDTTKTLSTSGTVTFWAYHVGGTPLKFYIDGSLVNNDNANYQGVWRKYSFNVASGTHTFKWQADFTARSASDKVYIDDISITNAGSAAALVVSGGNSGFGTSTPTATIDVRGTALFKNSVNSTAAFQIQTAGGTSFFTADSTNSIVTVTNLVVTASLTVNGHIISGNSSGTTTVAAGTAACTSPTVSVSGNDTAGVITVTTGTGCSAGGTLATVTFANAFAAAPVVTVTPQDSASASLQTYATQGTGTFVLGTNTTATNTTTYKFNYHTIQ